MREAAERLRRDPKLVYRWLSDGRLRGERFGHAWLVREREIERFRKHEPERREPRGTAKRRGGR